MAAQRGGIRERERRNKNMMVRSPIGSVVPRRTVYAHLFFFLILISHGRKGHRYDDVDDLVPDGAAS